MKISRLVTSAMYSRFYFRLASLTLLSATLSGAIGSHHLPSRLGSSSGTGEGRVVKHGRDFVPDEVLYVSYGHTDVACHSRPSVLVNGSTPGPELRLKPGRSTWIRVYNNIPDQNTTIVCQPATISIVNKR